MNVLLIGSDRSLFDAQSESAKRHVAYGMHFDKLNIIVFSRAADHYKSTTLSAGVHVYPTASKSRSHYGLDAFRIARTLRPNVVSVQDPFEMGLIGLLIAWRHNVPLHVQVHTDFLSLKFSERSFANRARVMLAGFVLRRAARIRVVSPRIKVSLQKKYHPRVPIVVMPIFVDTERFAHARAGALEQRFASFATKILVVSRLEREKNVGRAIDAFKRAAPQSSCLIVLGEGSEQAAFHADAPERVFFEGRQDPAPYYALADLVLVPSDYEGYGRTIVEAFAAGKPVVATDVGIAREMGAIITPSELFADALMRWFAAGPRSGTLKDYPYRSFEEYVQQYCADIAAAADSRKP